MNLVSHVQELKKKHETLSAEVESAMRNPGTDALHITEMKKKKLRLKEEINRLSGA